MPKANYYKLKRGDTLVKIAKSNKIKDWKGLWKHKSNEKLFKLYKGDQNKLQPGDLLNIPIEFTPDKKKAALKELQKILQKAAVIAITDEIEKIEGRKRSKRIVETTVRNLMRSPKFNKNIDLFVQQTLREGYRETNKDLHFYATKIKTFNATKKAIREEIKRARKANK